MNYTEDEIAMMVQSHEGFATLLKGVDTREGGEIGAPIVMQVISGDYSKSDENAIISAVQFMIDNYKSKLEFERYKGLSDSDPVCEMYLKYIAQGELMLTIIKVCLSKHTSTNVTDIRVCNLLYAILATTVSGAVI